MNTYKRYRFPPDIISYAVWLYYRFNLSRRRCAGTFKSTASSITCGGRLIRMAKLLMYVCRPSGMGQRQKRFFQRLLRSHGGEPRKIVTVKLRSYPVVHREVMSEVIHETDRYANNRVEQTHEATRVRERGMRKFKSVRQAQRFVTAHAAVQNLFNLSRHLVGAQHYRDLRIGAFGEWSRAVA